MLLLPLKIRVDRLLHAFITECMLIGLILLSVALVFLEAGIARSSAAYQQVLHLQAMLTAVFWIELGLRYWVARSKRRFWRYYWLDLLAIVPFINAFRVLRLLRLLRLLRVGVLLNRNLGRFSSPLAAAIAAQIGLVVTLGLVLLAGALGLYFLEGTQNAAFATLEESFWWSLLTLVAGEPIGAEPQTTLGRLLTLIVMLGGLTLFAVVTGVVSAVMVQRLRSIMEFRTMELDELRDHTVICGWNRNALHIIEELLLASARGDRALVVVAEFTDTPEAALRHLNRSQLYCYSGDYTRLDVLQTVGIAEAAHVILLADATRPRSDQDRDARTVLAALTIEKLNPTIYTCAQLLDRSNDVQLKAAGVDDVIVADELTSHMIATSVRTQGSVAILAELLTVQTGNQIYKLPVPTNWIDHTFEAAANQLKTHWDALLLAVETPPPEPETQVNPPLNYRLNAGDRLVVIARRKPQMEAG